MKNNYELKKYLKIVLLCLIVLTVLFGILEKIEYKKYSNILNRKIEQLVDAVKSKYPNVTDEELIYIINNNENVKSNFLKKYSIDIENDEILKENKFYNRIFLTTNVMYFIFAMLLIIFIFIKYNNKKDKNIESITKCIEEINKKNYKLDLDGISEDELSILKNEIYKTTIMLKEQAENSLNDKVKLKDSLSDISHQLKTPLTSIMILLDNLIDNPNMEPSIREDFIKEIKIETNNISFLVQAILKLSKFDSNTVEYINKEINLSSLIDKSVKKLLPLCDLKNIEINVNLEKDDTIVCDEMWQIEAIANIIKNCVEHSESGNKVNITISSNNVYSVIQVVDFGSGIEKQDLPHIFERFYKGKNSDNNSIGIGLALSKAIINKNNGNISVESELGIGTTFTIKYFK